MVNFSYICGAEQNDIINTDLGGVPGYIPMVCSDSAKSKGASLSLYILTN